MNRWEYTGVRPAPPEADKCWGSDPIDRGDRMMNRRTLVTGIAGAAAWPLAARAQQPAKIHRVGIIIPTAPVSTMTGVDPINPPIKAFIHGLRDLGYIEGQNLILEPRSTEGLFERSREIVTELIGRKVDVIVVAGNELAKEAKRVTRIVPIVMAAVSDPIDAGIISSLARPGGNVTGFTVHVGPEIDAKRLQLLKDALPEASRISFLGTKADWEGQEGTSVRAAAQILGVTLIHAEHTTTHFADAFASITRIQPHALFVARHYGNYGNRKLITDFAMGQRMPGMYVYREYVEAGGLMSYGANLPTLFRRAAGHVDKILKGAKPADLPVEQPTHFELVINGRTAKALGLTIPPTLLAFATEVIE